MFLLLLAATIAAPPAVGGASPTINVRADTDGISPVITVDQGNAVAFRFYPSISLRRGEAGRVTFRVSVDQDGKLLDCTTAVSSGFPRLDAATCELLAAKTSFLPLFRGSDPDRFGGLREGVVEWVLPRGTADRAAPAKTVAFKSDDDMICRRHLKTGSMYIYTKTCLTRREWKLQELYTRDQVGEMQNPHGPLQ